MRYICLTVGGSRLKNIEIIKTQIPELEVFVDTNREKFNFLLKVWDNIKNDDVIWLEDDITLCNNFKEKVENEIKFFGNKELISFFYAPINIDKSGMHDSKFFKSDSRSIYRSGEAFIWNQCVFIPKGFSEYFIYYYNEFKNINCFKFEGFNYDNCIAYSLGKMKQNYWLIRPSLVQHNLEKSTLNHNGDRTSLFFNKDNLHENGYHFEYVNVKLLISRLPRHLKVKRDNNEISKIISQINKHISIDYNNINFQVLYACLEIGIEYIYVRCVNKNEVLSLSKL